MRIGLYFGSFNPVHIGHLIVADSILLSKEVERIWFVVSPKSPFKQNDELLHHFDRLDLLSLAIQGNGGFAVSDVEFNLPQPNYTVDTLSLLRKKFPQHQFDLIIGEDNLSTFHRWKDYQEILKHHRLLVYPRPKSTPHKLEDLSKVVLLKAPLIEISATEIRRRIKNGHSIKYLVPDEVATLISLKKFFL